MRETFKDHELRSKIMAEVVTAYPMGITLSELKRRLGVNTIHRIYNALDGLGEDYAMWEGEWRSGKAGKPDVVVGMGDRWAKRVGLAGVNRLLPKNNKAGLVSHDDTV